MSQENIEEFWKLFQEESEDGLNSAEDCLVILEKNREDKEQIHTLFRAIHTLKGSSQMMGLTNLGSMAHIFEDIVGLVRDQGVLMDDEMHDQLCRTIDTLRLILEAVFETRQDCSLDDYQETHHALKDLFDAHQHHADETPKGVVCEYLSTDECHYTADLEPALINVYINVIEYEMLVLDDMHHLMQSSQNFEKFSDVKRILNSLIHASEQIGYKKITCLLQQLYSEIYNSHGEDFIRDWESVKAYLKEEITKINSCQEASFDKTDAEKSDHQSNEYYVELFSDLANIGLIHLKQSFNKFSESGANHDDIYKILEILRKAAESMKYRRIVAHLDQLEKVIFNYTNDAHNKQILGEAELKLYKEFSAIFDIVGRHKDIVSQNEVASVFILSYAKQTQKNINRLNTIFKKTYDIHEELKNGHCIELDSVIISDAIKVLKNIYHSCVFYSLNTAAQLTIVLEDLYSRILQKEFSINQKLIDVSAEYIVSIELIFLNPDKKDEQANSNIERLLDKIKGDIFVSVDSQVSQITTKVLKMINVYDKFHSVLTPENIIEISEHLQNGLSFYTLLADLESDEAIGMRFYEACNQGDIFAISNVTVYENEKTVFLFLLATPLMEDEFYNVIHEVDPDGNILKLSACTLKESEADPVEEIEDFFEAVDTEELEVDTSAPCVKQLDLKSCSAIHDDSAGVMNAISQLVTVYSSLQHYSENINFNKVYQEVESVFDQKSNVKDNLKKIKLMLENESEKNKKYLSEIMRDFDSSLDCLKKLSIKIRNIPVENFIAPLERTIKDIAYHFNKKINFEIIKKNKVLDREITLYLDEHLNSVLWFILAHSIENTEDRIKAHKNNIATICLTLEQYDDHLQLTIDEDGVGISDTLNLNSDVKQVQFDSLMHENAPEVKIRSDVSRGISFSHIQKELAKKNGFLRIAKSELGGNQYTFSVPLMAIVMDVMVVRIDKVYYVIPIKSIRHIIKPDSNMIKHISSPGGSDIITLNEKIIPVKTLTQDHAKRDPSHAESIYVIIESGDSSCAFNIDELIGQQQVLVHPLQGHLANISTLSGGAILADGQIGVILNVANIVQDEY